MMKVEKRAYLYLWSVLGGLLILLTWLESYYIYADTFIEIIIFCLLICNVFFGYFLQKNEAVLRIITLSLSGITILFKLVWLFAEWYPAFVLAQVLIIMLGFYCFYVSGRLSGKHINRIFHSKVLRMTLYFVKSAGILILGLISLVVIVNSITPAPLMNLIQWKAGDGNSYHAPDTEQAVLDSGYLRINDIKYGTDFPNSYLDVYLVRNDKPADKPTYFFVHGGGWTMGDKKMEDHAYYTKMLEAGYNVVSLNYALAPEYSYPAPLLQLSQAVAFMQEHGEKYGIDMSEVIFAGSSAGGQIVGQFLNVQTNEAYAEEMGMDPVMSQDNIKAAVLDSAALDPNRMGKTKVPAASSNWVFFQFSRAYFHVERLLNNTNEYARQGNVITYVTEDFPPAFIADGNTATFPDQARDLAEKLDHFGVTNYLYSIDRDEAVLGHVFMDTSSKYTEDYTNKKVSFLKHVLK